MEASRVGKLFVDLLPSLRGLVRAPRGVNLDDALHEALILILAQDLSDNLSDQDLEVLIREAVIQVSKRHVQIRVQHKKRFPPLRYWRMKSKFVPTGDEFLRPGPIARAEDPLHRIPDTRPSPVEELLEAEQRASLTTVATRIETDPGPRGVLYRLVYVDRRPLAEVARLLGISLSAVKKRAERLRKELRQAVEERS